MERFSLDVVNKTLTISADFAEKVKKADSDEYNLYLRLTEQIPGLSVVRKTHRTPKKYVSKSTGEQFSRNQFKDLTYKRMEQFLDGFSTDKSYRAEYDKVKAYAAIAKQNGYPLVRDWFIKQFPDFRKNPMVYFNNPPQIIPFVPKQENETATQTTSVIQKEEKKNA